MTLSTPSVTHSFEKSKKARSSVGYPMTLHEVMLACRQQGMAYAESSEIAKVLGFKKVDIDAWVEGRQSQLNRDRAVKYRHLRQKAA